MLSLIIPTRVCALAIAIQSLIQCLFMNSVNQSGMTFCRPEPRRYTPNLIRLSSIQTISDDRTTSRLKLCCMQDRIYRNNYSILVSIKLIQPKIIRKDPNYDEINIMIS